MNHIKKSVADSLKLRRVWKMVPGIYTAQMIAKEFHCSEHTARRKLEEGVASGEWVKGWVTAAHSVAQAYALKGTKTEYEV